MPAVNGAAMKAKGAAFERQVVEYLRANGFPYVERSYGAGRPDDRGDIDGLPRFAIEVKACRTIDLATFMNEASAEAANGGTEIVPAVIVKRRNRGTGDAYVVMRLSDWAELIREAEVP